MTKSKTLQQKLAELDQLVTWFEGDDVQIEQALKKFDQAEKLAEEIGSELKSAKNKIEIIKKKFDA